MWNRYPHTISLPHRLRCTAPSLAIRIISTPWNKGLENLANTECSFSYRVHLDGLVIWADFTKQRGINLDTSTYWHSSYFQKLPVLHFLRLNSHNLTMGCEQSADSIFFPFCKFVACWNAQRFHIVCAVFVRNLQLERLCSRDPQSGWPRAAFRMCPSTWGSCVLAHPAVSFLSPVGSQLIMYHYSAGNYNTKPSQNSTRWSW